MTIDYSEIGARISARRKELNLTQEMLTNLTDISTNQISNIENNHSVPTIDTILKLCTAMRVTPDYFLLGLIKDVEHGYADAISQKVLLCTGDQRKLVSEFIYLLINENYLA